MDRVQLGEAQGPAEPPRGEARRAPSPRSGPASSGRRGTRATTVARQAVARVRRDRRHEGVVLELADPRERPGELPRVGLGAADDPRDERQHRRSRSPGELTEP